MESFFSPLKTERQHERCIGCVNERRPDVFIIERL